MSEKRTCGGCGYFSVRDRETCCTITDEIEPFTKYPWSTYPEVRAKSDATHCPGYQPRAERGEETK